MLDTFRGHKFWLGVGVGVVGAMYVWPWVMGAMSSRGNKG